jgi:multidrug efflux pump
MNISKFFIDRPIFAGVLSVLIVLMGIIGVVELPTTEYPEVIPPQVLVHAQYPGANPKVIAETVAAPIEEKINGVEDMLYMQSQANSDGNMTTTVTFKLGTDPDKAQQLVQNRVSQALPRLPEDVQRLGVTTVKSSSTLTLVVHVVSPNDRYDTKYLRNYALLNLRDRLSRVRGVGEVTLKGSGDYAMRVWLDPQKVAEHGLTAGDVMKAIREQNVQVSAGIIGAAPIGPNVSLQLDVNAQGRLQTEEEFQAIVLKTSPEGGVTYLRDVARIEMGAEDYGERALLDNKQAVAIWVFQLPGASALQIEDDARKVMEEAKSEMPAGVESRIVWDSTRFVRSSIRAVIHTLLEAIALVVLVVIIFLQNWRASIIPLIAVPVSIIGTFSLLLAFGFSINVLTLFGLVLAIGIVVDDAIVVVENVERNIAAGLAPREATHQAMREVSGPIVAIALTLVAVFVPLAFMSGLTGQFYKQFAMTIAISTVISAFNSLTLAPALAASLLRRHDEPKDRLTRIIERAFGGFFNRFNTVFHRSSGIYGRSVTGIISHKAVMMAFYGVLLAGAIVMGKVVPGGFVPQQDKAYLITIAQLPNGASLDRTESVLRQMADIAMQEPGVESAVQHPGLSVNGYTSSSSAGLTFLDLKSFDERVRIGASGQKIANSLTAKYAAIKGAQIVVFPPPPVLGLGTLGGFKLQLEDRGSLGYTALSDATSAFIKAASKAPELGPLFSSYQINVPQLDVQFDRVKAKQLGVSVTDVFDTMQVYLGSAYANDFNRFGRVYQVRVQADAPFRSYADDIGLLKTRNEADEMVPLSSLVTVKPTFGPEMVVRYNGYTAADINGGPAPGFSSNQAQAAIERIAAETLPRGIKMEWTDLTYQQKLTGSAAVWVFPISVLLVFLVLAAQYESLTLPLAIILIVPVSILAALLGVWLTGGDNNIFTQIGLMVLVGLSAKNAILIVEFARELEMQGRSIVEAAIEASRMRLRPILMTSIAFIMGVLPMVASSGAGSEMRKAIGVTVFSGMLGVTLFGLMLVPVFYVLLRNLAGGRKLIGTQAAGLVAVTVLSAGCSVAPTYHRPEAAIPVSYKEAAIGPATQEPSGWKIAQPSEQMARGEWWTVFDDDALDELEHRALQANQSLKAAAARLREARANQQTVRADLFPTLDAGAGATRGKPSRISQGSSGNSIPPVQNRFNIVTTASYEVDLFGRVADSVKAAGADTEKSAALFRSVQLALQADVAQNYFNLRELDAELEVFDRTVSLRENALKLVQRRFAEGQISELDVARAGAELATARTDTMTVQRLRAVSEHRLAVLLGEPPAAFSIGPSPLRPVDIRITPGLPSSLLERRPDIAAAERAMAAANARIGVAKSAYFPSLTLMGAGGFDSDSAGNLVGLASRTFLLGPIAALPLFDGGRRRGNLAEARAQYEEDVANYRQQVLLAFQEVEDGLSDLRVLQEQVQTQSKALQASTRAAQLLRTQYTEGAVDYLDVIDAERTVLQSHRVALNLTGAQAVATVNLIRALGGGWDDTDHGLATNTDHGHSVVGQDTAPWSRQISNIGVPHRE